jgi:hypothetical protein
VLDITRRDAHCNIVIFVYVFQHTEAYKKKNYALAVREFQHQLSTLDLVYK